MCSWNIVNSRGSDKLEIVRCTVSFYVAEQRRVLTRGSLWRRTNCLILTTSLCLVCEPTTEDLHRLISDFASVGSRSAFSSFHPNVIFASRIPKHASTCDLKHTLSFPFSSTSIPEHCCVSAQSETAGGSTHLVGLRRQKKKHMSHNWSWSV